ncbi:MAG: acyl carrier protein phosphodiesterase [Crocinitomicaceae bacterium]|nr:acyl carrier protein phosphodiesterase [Crocinitomicaceae bacterium]
MNYLGHLYFSNNDSELMTANLFGDFVKGRDLSAYQPKVQEGILLHRKIDSFIDQSETVLILMRKLYASLPKVSSVAIDLFFDHLLAKNWNQFHPVPLDDFLNQYYQNIQLSEQLYAAKFIGMMQKLIEHNWISYYPTLYGLEKSCQGVSSRISFPNELKNGKIVFLEYEEEITDTFFQFMKEANEYFLVDYIK